MATADENKRTISDAYASFGDGNLSAAAEALSADIVWHMPGNSPVAGTYRGIDTVFGFLRQLAHLSHGTHRVEVESVLASDEHVAAVVHEYAQRSDSLRGETTLDSAEVHLWRMVDGRAVEFSPYRRDSAAVDEFWS